MLRPASRMVRFAIVASAALVFLANPLLAQDCGEPDPFPQPEEPPPEETTVELKAGPWSGSGVVAGTATFSQQGFEMLWDGVITGDFDFAVQDDGGPVVGDWTHLGGGTMTIDGAAGGRTISAEADLTWQGIGPMSGTGRRILLDGSSRTTGTVVVTSPGVGAISNPVDNTSQIPQLAVTPQSAVCDEAHGDWVFSVEVAFEAAGLTPSLDGHWTAWRLTDQTQAETDRVLDEIAELGFEGGETGDPDQGGSERSPLLDVLGRAMVDFQRFVDDYPGWSIDEVFDKLSKMEGLLNLLRSLGECDDRLFGEDNLEDFTSAITHALQNLIIGGAQLEGAGAVELGLLTQVAVRAGVVGPGSTNPFQAVRTEGALVDRAEALLEQHVDPSDNQILVNDATKSVFATAAAMDWNLQVAGRWYDARETWNHNLGDSETWEQYSPVPEECGA